VHAEPTRYPAWLAAHPSECSRRDGEFCLKIWPTSFRVRAQNSNTYRLASHGLCLFAGNRPRACHHAHHVFPFRSTKIRALLFLGNALTLAVGVVDLLRTDLDSRFGDFAVVGGGNHSACVARRCGRPRSCIERPAPAATTPGRSSRPSLSNPVCRLAHKLGGYLRMCLARLLTSQLNISSESREAK
jgi:hypothetical protein